MSQHQFQDLMSTVAAVVADRALDAELEADLNALFPAEGPVFKQMSTLCAQGEAEGWLMAREAGGIRYGRAIKPGSAAGVFSVDVVRMKDVKGPHHVHTKGEIGAIMPISGAPEFDGKGAGWYVYGAGTAHHPTVRDGEAYVLYLLPDGAIEFTSK